MADVITQALGGLFGGFEAGTMGFTKDLAVGSILNAFQTISPLFMFLESHTPFYHSFLALKKSTLQEYSLLWVSLA
jgi:hypothetical protein